MSSKIYYKVLDVRDGRLYSACRSDNILGDDWRDEKDHNFKLEYTENQWRTPKVEGSCLFLFETFQAGDDFIRKSFSTGQLEIWECLATNVRQPNFERPKYVSEAAWLWQQINSCRKSKKKIYLGRITLVPWPEGTLIADSLKLTKRVHGYNFA